MTDKQFDKDAWQTPQYVFNWLDSRVLRLVYKRAGREWQSIR